MVTEVFPRRENRILEGQMSQLSLCVLQVSWLQASFSMVLSLSICICLIHQMELRYCEKLGDKQCLPQRCTCVRVCVHVYTYARIIIVWSDTTEPLQTDATTEWEPISTEAQLCFPEYPLVEQCVLFQQGISADWSTCILELLLKCHKKSFLFINTPSFYSGKLPWISCMHVDLLLSRQASG